MSEFPKENPKPNEDPMLELEPLDRLIDSSLEEILGDARPMPIPLVYERIAAGKTPKLFSENQLDRVAQRSLQEVQSRLGPSRDVPRPSKASWIPLGSLVACIAIASLIGWWATLPKTNPLANNRPTANSDDPSPIPSSEATEKRATENRATEGVAKNDASSMVVAPPQELDAIRHTSEIEDSASQKRLQQSSGKQSSGRSLVDGDLTSPPSHKNPLGAPSDREVALVIDSQFEQIWNQVGLLDPKARSLPLSVDRIAKLLLHRVPTNTELEAIRREKLTNEVSVEGQDLGELTNLTNRWIASEEFDRVWAESLASFYLGGSPILGDSRITFRNWLEEQIRSDVPIQEIQRSVLLGLWDPDHPASCLLEAWSELSRETSSRGVQWVGVTPAEANRLSGISQLFINVTGNTAIGCTQCHAQEAQDFPDWLREHLSDIAKTSSTKPVVFESVAALLVQAALPGRSELFSKQQDDRLSKSMVRLPDGKRIGAEDSTQQVVNAWIEKGSHFQTGLINALWKDFFGEALHSQFGIDSGVAIQERRDLLEFLGKQAVEKRAGVRQFVYWLLISKPTRQPEEAMSYPQYMASDSQRLRDYWTSRGVFKSLLLKPDRSAEANTLSIDRYASSVFPERADWLERSLLAQPSNSIGIPPKANLAEPSSALNADGPSVWSPSMLNAELRFRLASEDAKKWAQLLAKSKLTDPEVVEHAYLMSKHRFPSAQEHKAWADREWSRSERSSAILRLLAGVESF